MHQVLKKQENHLEILGGAVWGLSMFLVGLLGVDRLSAWPIIGADIKHFTDYRYRPF